MKRYLIYTWPILALIILTGALGLKVESNTSKKEADPALTRDQLFSYVCQLRIDHPKVVLAQAIQESGLNSPLFKEHNNLLGMKKAYQRTAVQSSDTALFAHYDSWQQCVVDYALWQLQQKGVEEMTDLEYIAYLDRVYCKDGTYKKRILTIYNNLNYE